MNRKATLITFGMREYGKARDVPKEFTQIRLDFKGHSLFSSVQFSVTWMGQGMLLLLQHISCCHHTEELEVSKWISDANELLVNSIYFRRKSPKKHSQSITKPYSLENTALLTLISLFVSALATSRCPEAQLKAFPRAATRSWLQHLPLKQHTSASVPQDTTSRFQPFHVSWRLLVSRKNFSCLCHTLKEICWGVVSR